MKIQKYVLDNNWDVFSFSHCAAKAAMEGTVFTPSLQGMKHVKTEGGEMLTKPFLEVCKQILPVLGVSSNAK